jgi:hypothetical protein
MTEKGFDPQYDDNKEKDVIIFGKATSKPDGSVFRKVDLLVEPECTYLSEGNAETLEHPMSLHIREDVILYSTQGGQQKVHCWLVESPKGKHVDAIHISRRTSKGVYSSQEITLLPQAIIALKQFLDKLFLADTSDKSKFKIPLIPPNVTRNTDQIISQTDFANLIKANVKSTDDFYKLLTVQKMQLAITELESIIKGNYENEVDIQKFLKKNLWMFGNDYVHIVEDEKISPQNILDVIPQNIESYVDIIEVKLPSETLFRFDTSHHNYYCASKLTKAIAQTQNYIFELERKSTDEQYQQENDCKIIRPRGIILYGSGEEIGADQSQYLRILNSSYHNLQIITYQQLLQKAKNTLAFSEQ